jgi:hypothetical protein
LSEWFPSHVILEKTFHVGNIFFNASMALDDKKDRSTPALARPLGGPGMT